MTETLDIPAGERGKVRVFTIDLPDQIVRSQRETGEIYAMLGAIQLDLSYVEIFPVADLDDIGLSGYLKEGCGIAPEDVADDAANLNAIKGYVILVLSRAFGGQAVSLKPANELRLIGTYSEVATDWSATPIKTESAKPRVAVSSSPRDVRSRARRIGGGFFAVVMLLIVLVLVLVIR